MESLTSRKTNDAQKQEEIRRKIIELQAELKSLPEIEKTPPREISQKQPAVLAPSTPSPKKRKREPSPAPAKNAPRKKVEAKKAKQPDTRHPYLSSSSQPAQPSNLIAQLRSMHRDSKETKEPVVRSEGFSDQPAPARSLPVKRDDNLVLIENLEMGPAEHKAPADDLNFEKLEPNSGIRLTSRILSHEALQDHLYGRYFLPPSLLYSVVRPSDDKKSLEVPVEGDWVTIAVVAERGEIKFTKGPGNSRIVEEKDNLEKLQQRVKGDGKQPFGKENWKNRKKNDDEDDDEGPKRLRKKFAHLRLVDLGIRSRSSIASSSTSKNTLRGDAQLSLLLFEADSHDKIVEKDERGKEKVQKIWRGGSGGAFEDYYSKLREGTVVALLNHKVLKPIENPKFASTSSILAVTPPSASAIAIIGHAKELGMCTVRKKDGKPCGAWVDRRTIGKGEDVCEYHVQHAVQRARAGRAEFSVGTSGMTSSAAKGPKGGRDSFDPDKKWGLLPADGSTRGANGESTYVLGGYVAQPGGVSASHSFGGKDSDIVAPGIAESRIGREGQARAKRRQDVFEERNLAALLERGAIAGSGASGSAAAESVRLAREAVAKMKHASQSRKGGEIKKKDKSLGDGSQSASSSKVGARMTKTSEGDEEDSDESGSERNRKRKSQDGDNEKKPKRMYSAELVKKLGFDPLAILRRPSAKGGGNSAPSNLAKRLTVSAREVDLRPHQGKKLSNVAAPSKKPEPEALIFANLKEKQQPVMEESSDLEIEYSEEESQGDKEKTEGLRLSK